MRGPNPTIEDKRAQVVALDRQIADLKSARVAELKERESTLRGEIAEYEKRENQDPAKLEEVYRELKATRDQIRELAGEKKTGERPVAPAEPSAPEALDKKQLLAELKREVQSILKRREERARVFRELKNGLGETEDEYQRQLEVLERSLVRAEIAGKPWYSSSWLAKKIRRDIIKLKKGYGKE